MAYYPPPEPNPYPGWETEQWRDPNQYNPHQYDPNQYAVEPYGHYPPQAPGIAEPDRRFNRWWLVGLGAALLALIVGIAVVRAPGSGDDKDSLPAGSLTEQWRQGSPVSLWSAAVVGQVVVAIECNQRGGPYANGAQCVLRGRSLADGHELWKIDDQPLGLELATVGDSVVVTGDGVPANVRQNAAGSLAARQGTLLVNASDGRVIKAFQDQVMWRYSQQTFVLRDLAGTADSHTLTAVDSATGAIKWQFAAAVAPNVGVTGFTPLLPAGLSPVPFSAGDVAVMMGKDATVVRKLDTGEDLATVARDQTGDAQFITIIDDMLIRKVPGTTASLQGVTVNSPNTPSWKTDIPADGIPVQCSDLICVNNQVKSSSSVINPVNGRMIAKHDKGAMYARSGGSAVAIMRCAATGSITDPCPLKDLKTEVVSASSGRVLWRGDPPVVATAVSHGSGQTLVVGVSKAGAGAVTLLAFPQKGNAVQLGKVDRVGFATTVDVQTEPISDGYAPTHLPTLVCAGQAERLVCGSRWLLTQPVSWKYATTKAAADAK